MASLRVPAFDHEGRPIQFDTWLEDLRLYLLSDSRDSVSLFDLTSGTAPAPLATANTECAHFGQHRTAQALYDAVISRHSSPATAALGRLLLPYLFPELSTFATVEDLVSNLRTIDARYRGALPAEFLDRNPPPMDHFLSLDPTSLTVDLLEQHLLAPETSTVAVNAARGTPRTPFFEGCSPSPLAPSYASAAAVDVLSTEDVGNASASAQRRSSKDKGGRGGGGAAREVVGAAVEAVEAVEVVAAVGVVEGVGTLVAAVEVAVGVAVAAAVAVVAVGLELSVEVLEEASGSGSSVGARPLRPSSFRAEFGDEVERPHWAELLRSSVAIFDLDYDAILSTMYALSASAEGDCYRCVPPDHGIEAATLGASESVLPGTVPAEALHTITLDSGASRCFFRDSTTLTPLPAPVPVRLADPSWGPVIARSSTILQCSAVPSGSLSGLHLPSFSTNLRVLICTCTRTGRHLATFTHRPGSSLYTLATEPPQTLLWHHHLGHPSLPHLRGMHSRLLVSSLPRSLPPLPPSPAPPCLPCVEGRQRAAPHSSSFPPTTAPLQTLHMDDLPVLCLHSERGGEFPSNLLREFCRGEGILQSFTLSDPTQQNGIAERRIGLVMELNLWPRVSLPETSPTLLWTGKVGDASVFRVWVSRTFVRDTSADKLSARAIPCVFLGIIRDVPGWQFYHPTLRRVFPSQGVTFDESVPFYHLFPYRSAPPLPLLLFLAPSPPLVDPLPPQGPAPSGVSQVDPLPDTVPVQVAVDSGASPGAAAGGAVSGGAEPRGAESEGAGFGGAEPRGEEPGGAEPAGVETGGVEPGVVESEGAEFGGAEPRATGAGGTGDAGAGGAGVTAGADGSGGTAAASPRRARPRGAGAAAYDGVGGAGAGDPTEPGAAGAGGSCAGSAGAQGAGAGGAGVGGIGARGAGVARGGAVDARARGARGTVRPRPYFVPLLQQVLGVLSSTSLTPPLLCPPPDQSQPPLLSASPLPTPSPYIELSGGLTEHCEPASLLSRLFALLVSFLVCVILLSPARTLWHSSDRARAASPTVSRLLATAVTDPSFEPAAASALVAELLDFAAAYRLYYATALVAESESASPPSVKGECTLGTDVLEDRQEDIECLVAAVPRFTSMLVAPEGDPDAANIPTPRSYAEAITSPYSSLWQAAMDVEMASWKSTGTYVDKVPPPGANIVDGMWFFWVKRPPRSPHAFKARYVTRGFGQQQRVDYFQTFSPTPKMTTLRVLLHVTTLHDYELHSVDFNTIFLQGSLHEKIWLRRSPGFTGSFPCRTTLAALEFTPSTADPSLFLRTDTSLPPFYVLVYVDDLVFATADTEVLTFVKSKLQNRHTCTNLGLAALWLPFFLATAHSSVYQPLVLV
ncbi:unnamed protein product [Closterium sp. NIES-53]